MFKQYLKRSYTISDAIHTQTYWACVLVPLYLQPALPGSREGVKALTRVIQLPTPCHYLGTVRMLLIKELLRLGLMSRWRGREGGREGER